MILFWRIMDDARFMVSLLFADFLFFWLSSKRQKGFAWKAPVGAVICILICSSAAFWRWSMHVGFLRYFTNISWFILMVLLSMAYCKFCFQTTGWENTFRCTCGYSVQQIAYIIHYHIILLFAKGINNYWYLRFIIPSAVYVAVYVLAYFTLAKRLNRVQDGGGAESKLTTKLSVLLSVCLVVFNMFTQSMIPPLKDYLHMMGIFTMFLGCALIGIVQHGLFNMKNLNEEVDTLKQFLREKEKQYELSRKNIEIINLKCHDLKHQLQALKIADNVEKERVIHELESSIMIYDAVVKTDNEVVNTILTEKCLYCEKHKIKLSCIIDASRIDRISTVDMYIILGNALDNAIECVRQYKDKSKCIISLNIHNKGEFLCIRIDNYFEGELILEGGLPVTTKTDKDTHGFGIKSTKMIAEKYGGSVYLDVQDKMFSLQIIIPIV